jgi:hypothetical protein
MSRRAAAFGAALVALLVFAAAAQAAPGQRGARGVERFWTPARMAAARPLEMTVGPAGHADVRLGRRPVVASASYSLVPTPETPPYAWNGRLFVVQGGEEGFCSATAIDSPSRSLVLTAGHCVNTGPEDGEPGTWSTEMEFVPGFNLGVAPYGTFALEGRPRALRGWTEDGNPDYDLGAFLVAPNAEGVPLGEAVGGGAKIVTDLPRAQRFETFGYPGSTERMRHCVSGSAGQDPVTFGLPGPSTVGVHCRWAPGASGGGWLIDGGTEIDGLNAYVELTEKHRTFGPYFAAGTVGRLVAGL